MSITHQQVKAYETDGYITGIPISGEAEAVHHQELFNELEAREGREKCQVGLLDRHIDEEFIWELATHPKILDCIEKLIGPDILLLGCWVRIRRASFN